MEPYSPFVQPKKVRLPLKSPPGQFIDIKDRLNAGEQEDLHAAWQPILKGGHGVELQTRHVRFAKVIAYLLGWSFIDEDGQPVEVSDGAIASLDPKVFTEIHKLIEAHETQRDAEVGRDESGPSWRDRVERNLAICRAMNGWKYDWVEALPREVLEVCAEWLSRPAER